MDDYRLMSVFFPDGKRKLTLQIPAALSPSDLDFAVKMLRFQMRAIKTSANNPCADKQPAQGPGEACCAESVQQWGK